MSSYKTMHKDLVFDNNKFLITVIFDYRVERSLDGKREHYLTLIRESDHTEMENIYTTDEKIVEDIKKLENMAKEDTKHRLEDVLSQLGFITI